MIVFKLVPDCNSGIVERTVVLVIERACNNSERKMCRRKQTWNADGIGTLSRRVIACRVSDRSYVTIHSNSMSATRASALYTAINSRTNVP
jgi:hypothetical protein